MIPTCLRALAGRVASLERTRSSSRLRSAVVCCAGSAVLEDCSLFSFSYSVADSFGVREFAVISDGCCAHR